MTPYRGNRSRFLSPAGLLLWRRRATTWTTAALVCFGGITLGPKAVTIATPALAQATSGMPLPPDNAQVMVAGQRIRRPFGWIEIRTFGRSEQSDNSIFDVNFLVINTTEEEVTLEIRNLMRLVADGIPRTPAKMTCPASEHSYSLHVATESAEFCNARFSVHGQPNLVHVQFGTGELRAYFPTLA